jgi:integrase
MPTSSESPRNRKSKTAKPAKPYPDFPLGPANNGRWCKKIRGTIRYFGRWGTVVNGSLTVVGEDGNWQAALALYKAQKDDYYAGRTPRVGGKGLTVMDLCNRFLTAKLRAMESGELAARTFMAYRGVTDILIATFGNNRLVEDLAADDFESLRAKLAKSWGPVRLGSEIVRIKSVFKYGVENGLIEKAIRYGSEFKKPSKSVLRKSKAAKGKRLFDAAEIRSILDKASPQLKAMILLGVNCGFGNADCSHLPQRVVDLEGGWISFTRPKTGVDRRCPLWPETIAALKAASIDRPAPVAEADADLVFVTKYGNPWVRTIVQEETETGPKHTPIDSVGLEFGKLLRGLKLDRPGLGFYALRHTFRTIADGTRDFPAARLIMGHTDGSMDAVYTEHIDDTRLKAVTDHVRAWLWPKPAENPADQPAKPKRQRKPRRAAADSPKPRARAAQPVDTIDQRPQLRIVG